MAQLGRNLIRQRKWIEAESLLRECLAIREKIQADDRATFDTRSLLGASLLGQGRFAEAEPLLLAGYEGLKVREAGLKAWRPEDPDKGAMSIVSLYEAWGRPKEAAAWRAKLGLAELSADPFARRVTGPSPPRSAEGRNCRRR
jgi:hypothetical protein